MISLKTKILCASVGFKFKWSLLSRSLPGLCIERERKELKKMKEDNIPALVRKKVDKENEVLELRKTTEKLSNKIAYRKRKVGINSRCSDGGACNIYD